MQSARSLSRFFICNLYVAKPQNWGAPTVNNQPLKLYRHIHPKMIDSSLQPPSHVKGMKTLNKDQFDKTITVPCIYLPYSSINTVQKPLKSYLLKLQNFRPLTDANQVLVDTIKRAGVVASVEEGKMAVLDPRKVKSYTDIADNDRNILGTVGINENYFSFIEMILKYDNWKADEVLRAVIPSELESVSGYSLIGHIIHLNLRDCLSDYKLIIANVLLDKVKPARTVVNKIDIIDNTYRNFQMEILCGDKDMVVNVNENKCVFQFDFSEVYWNPRLCTEHERITEKLSKGSVVYDVFCGVGPFSIPAAKKGCSVLANDLNPHSVKWLKKNIKLNKVDKNVHVFNKDGGLFIREDMRRHMLTLKAAECSSINVIMNLPALAPTFLSNFHNLFSDEELKQIALLPVPRVVVYCFIKGICNADDAVIDVIGRELGMEICQDDEEIEDIFFVRDVAPNKKMMRVTLKLTRKILANRKRSRWQTSEIEDSESKKACL